MDEIDEKGNILEMILEDITCNGMELNIWVDGPRNFIFSNNQTKRIFATILQDALEQLNNNPSSENLGFLRTQFEKMKEYEKIISDLTVKFWNENLDEKPKPINMEKLNTKIKEGAERIKTKKEALLGVIPNTTAIRAIVDKRKENMEIGDTPSEEIPILGWELYATGEWPIIPEILCNGPIYLIAPDGRYYSLDDWTVYEDRGDWYMNAPLPPAE